MRVLIVDDDEQVLGFLKEASEMKPGIEVEIALSGEDAVAKTLQTNYDVITLDIKMPGISGLDVLPMLRNLRSHTIIAIISGHLPDEISPEVSSCADVILDKPITVPTFHKFLDSSLLISNTLSEIRQMGARLAETN